MPHHQKEPKRWRHRESVVTPDEMNPRGVMFVEGFVQIFEKIIVLNR
jgi:hypothetical protein